MKDIRAQASVILTIIHSQFIINGNLFYWLQHYFAYTATDTLLCNMQNFAAIKISKFVWEIEFLLN